MTDEKAELERLKKVVSLLRLVEGQGYQVEKRGKDWAMRCVFHEEATASLTVSPEKNLSGGYPGRAFKRRKNRVKSQHFRKKMMA